MQERANPRSKAKDDAVTLLQSCEAVDLEFLRMDFGNWIMLSRKRLCDFTGVSQTQV